MTTIRPDRTVHHNHHDNWTKDELVELLDTIQEGVFVVDNECHITFFNHAAEIITGTKKIHAVSRPCWEVLRADCCGDECLLRKTLATGGLFSERPVTMITADGTSRRVSIATTVLRTPDGTVKGAVETFRDLSPDDSPLLDRLSAYRYRDIITINQRMQKILETLPMIADSDSTVLLQGESGTGKELFARAIHSLGPRREKPFVAINCSALPDTLLESELFGHAAGAFTDAKKDKAGRFALAEGGTLFLDEIGDTSVAMQVKLLRVLQEKVYEPLGSTQSRRANVRIIAATNRHLEAMVTDGSFRKDLYYRLNVIRIVVPPLRERKDDLPLLADYFINKLNKQQHKQVQGLADRAMAQLVAHDFPGNVRELENMIERAFVLCRTGYIGAEHLFGNGSMSGTLPERQSQDTGSLKQIEAAFLRNALERNNWERETTARELGVNRSTLYRKMKLYHINQPGE